MMAGTVKRRMLGFLLCLCAVASAAGGWIWFGSIGEASTDNAYVRGDVTSLAPKVAGYVVSTSVEDNQWIGRGDVLFRIDNRDYLARLAQANANIEAARARVTNIDSEIELQRALVRQANAEKESVAAELDLATKASDRRRELIRSNAVSQASVDESDAARLRAQAGLRAAEAAAEAQETRISVLVAQRLAAIAALAQAQAARDLAQIDLDSTVVRAPVDGVVGNRQVRVGRFVTAGSPLLDIVPVDDLWVVANFKETQIQHIRRGQNVSITIDGYPGRVFRGMVDSFAPGSGAAFSLLPPDNATGNFIRVVQRVPVKIRFSDTSFPVDLVPGLSARVEVDLTTNLDTGTEMAPARTHFVGRKRL